MDDVIAVAIIVTLLALLAFVLLAYQMAFRELTRRYQHSQKMATGSFKVLVSAKEWQEAMEKGALAVGVKDSKTGNVAFTVIIQREDAKTP